MATWLEIRAVLERVLPGFERLGDELCRASVLIKDAQEPGKEVRRQVYVHRCAIPANDGGPDMEFIAIDGPVAAVGEVDVLRAAAIIGQYNPCVLAYLQGGDGGYLSAGTRILADIIDISEPGALLLHVHFVGFAAHQLSAELRHPTGSNAERAARARTAAWEKFGQLLLSDPEITIERDWPDGKAFVIWVTGAHERRHRLFVAINDREDGEQHVMIEYSLGDLPDPDLRRAAEATGAGIVGLVAGDGFTSYRVSQNLTALTPARFNLSVAHLLLAVESFESARASA